MGGGCHSLRRLCFRTCLKIENNKEYCYEQSNTHVGRIMLSAEPGLDRIDTGAYLVPVGWDALQVLVWYTHPLQITTRKTCTWYTVHANAL